MTINNIKLIEVDGDNSRLEKSLYCYVCNKIMLHADPFLTTSFQSWLISSTAVGRAVEVQKGDYLMCCFNPKCRQILAVAPV